MIDTWHSIKAKSILKYLVIHRYRPVPKEELMEILWPGCDPKTANNNIKTAVYNLRRGLNQHYEDSSYSENGCVILYRECNYLLNPELDIWVDVDKFQRHWTDGQVLERKGETDLALREYMDGERLYTGDLFEDSPYEEWAFMRRETLREMYIGVVEKLAMHSFEVGEYDQAISYYFKVLDIDSCCEEAYRGLMRCWEQLGDRGRAIKWFHICCKNLRDGISVSPGQQTIALYKRLKESTTNQR